MAGADGRVTGAQPRRRADARARTDDGRSARDYREVLPLATGRQRDWWQCTDAVPAAWRTRTGQPSGCWSCAAGPRAARHRPLCARRRAAVQRLVVALRGHPGPPAHRAQPRRPGRHRRARAALPADQRQGLHRDAARQVGPVHDEQKQLMLADGQRRRRPRHPADRRAARRRPASTPAGWSCASRSSTCRRRPARSSPGRSRRASRRTGSARGRTAALPEIGLDPDKVDQVCRNLLENALRHGAGTVTIDDRAAARPPTARARSR